MSKSEGITDLELAANAYFSLAALAAVEGASSYIHDLFMEIHP